MYSQVKKTIRMAREKLDLRWYIRRDHMERMIGIRQRWKKKGIKIVIKYKGRISTAKIDRALTEKMKKNNSDSHALRALEDYSGATPKEIFYYDANNSNASLLDLDGCPWEAVDRYTAINYLKEHTQRPSPQINPQSQLLATSITPQLAFPPKELIACQTQLVSGTTVATNCASRTVWEWVATASDNAGILSSGRNTSLYQQALELYVSHSGNTCFDPHFMEKLFDQLLDNYQLDEADKVASLGVALADSLYDSTDSQSSLARSKLANVRNLEGKYYEAYHIGQVAVDGLKTKYGEYHEDVLQAECRLSDTLLELGDPKRAETMCRDVLNRSLFMTEDTILFLKFQLARMCNRLGSFHEAREILEFVATEWEKKLGFSAEITLRANTELGRALLGLGSWEATTRLGLIEHEISRRECNGSPRSMWTVELVDLVARQQYYCGAHMEAEICFRNAFEYIRERVQSSSHPKVVNAEGWIAISLYCQGKTREAAAIFKKCISVFRDIKGFHHRATLTYMCNLAWALKDEIRFADFKARMLNVRNLRVRYLGEDDPHTINSEYFCAELKASGGEWDDLLAIFKKLHKAQKKIYKSSACPEIMACLLSNSLVLNQRHDDTRAEEMQRQALALGKQLFGADHPRALVALVPLSRSLSKMSRYSEAEALLSEGVSKLSGSLGKKHHKVMELELACAQVLVSQKRYKDAADRQSQVLKEYRANYGEDHPYVINVKALLAENLTEENMFMEAQELFKTAIQSCRSSFSPNHRMICNLELSLATLLRKQRHFRQALCLGQKVWKQSNTSLGYIEAISSSTTSSIEHPETITALENLAFIRDGLGDIAESTALFNRILSLCIKLKGPNHPYTIETLSNLAWAYTQSKDYFNGEQLYRQVVQKKSAIFGEWHSQTTSARLDLGTCLRESKKFLECEDMYIEMLVWLFNHSGEGHNDVARTYKALAYLRGSQGNFIEAEKYLKYALRIFRKVGSDGAVNSIMIDLCDCYSAMKDDSRAEVQAKQIICHLDATLGRHNPWSIRAQIALAGALCGGKKYFEADDLIGHLRQDIEEYEGQHSSRLLWVELLHAKSMYAQGRIWDADTFLESCISRRDCKDIRDPTLCKMKQFLATIKGNWGMLPEKEAILQNLLESLEQSSLNTHNMTISEILQELSLTRISLRKYESAETSIKRALDLQEGLWGKESKQTFNAERIMAKCLVNDRLQERMRLQEQILLKYKNSSNLDHEDIFALKRELATTYYLANDFELELPIRQEIITTRPSTGNPDHLYILDLQSLALVHYNLGNYEEAETRFECLDGIIREQIPDDVKTLTWNMHHLTLAKKELRKMDEAESLLERALILRRHNPYEDLAAFLASLDYLAYLKMKAYKWSAAKALLTEWLAFRRQAPEYDRPPIVNQLCDLEYINSILSSTESATDEQSATDTQILLYDGSDSDVAFGESSSPSSLVDVELLEPVHEA